MKNKKLIIGYWSFLLGILCFFPVFVHASVVINEVQITGSTATDEFVELYNAGSESVDLAGWRLTKQTASGNEYNLLTSFPSHTIQPGSFFVIGHEHFSGTKQTTYSTSQSLAQDNAVVLYRDAGDTIVDLVGFGSATTKEGVACQNQVEGNSLQRVPNGVDTDQNSADFVSAKPTPGQENSQDIKLGGTSSSTPSGNQTNSSTNSSTTNSSSPTSSSSQSATTANISISEILPNPVGNDTEGEWIELKNNEIDQIDLVGWVLEDSSGHAFIISKSLQNTTVAPNGFYTLDYSQTKISLNNTSDVVALKRPGGTIADRVSYSDLAEGQSYANIENAWKITDTPTKNASNVLTESQKHESIKIQKQESSTPLNPPLRRGEQKGGLESNTNEETSGNLSNTSNGIGTMPLSLKGKIRFSEIMPNPEGDDEEGEWIEIENVSGESLKLAGLKIKDKTSENLLPEKTISAKGFVVYPKPEFSLTLNNSSESLQLVDATGELIDNVSYDDSQEGVSYSRVNEKWIWTESSKGTANKETRKEEKKETSDKTSNSKTTSKTKAVANTVSASGTVLVRPNVFGKTIIYISGDDGNHQIYFQKGDWPELTDGDVIEVRGQTSTAGDVPRIKIQSPEQMTVVSEGSGVEPEDRSVEELSEDDVGGLFRITGETLESSGSSLIIGDETGELEVYFKSSEVKKPTFQQGKSVRTVGILVKSSKGIRLLPRYPEDLEFSSSKVLGASDELPEQRNGTPWKAVGGAALVVGVVGYSFRQKILEQYQGWKTSKRQIDDSMEE